MAVTSKAMLIPALLVVLSFALLAQAVQLPLRTVPIARSDVETWSLGWLGRLLTPKVSPAGIGGSFGWETLQIPVALGTPAQPFNLSIDYSGSTVLVFAEGYNETHCKGVHAIRDTFSPKKSSSFSTGNADMAMELNVPFADVKDCGGLNNTGWSAGQLVIDHLTVDSKMAPNISFYLMYSAQHLNPKWASDGLFGLSVDMFDCQFDEDNCTILGLMRNFGDPVVSVSLRGGADDAISFGSLDLKDCSNKWTWLPQGVPSLVGWNVLVNSFTLGSYKSGKLGRPAVLAAIASYIWAPPKIFPKILKALGAEYSFADDEYIVRCSKIANLPPMNFDLGKVQHNVGAQLYTKPIPNDPKTCVVLVRDSTEYFAPGIDSWIVGTSFLRASCHAFDFKRQLIGFADFVPRSG